MSRIGGRTVYVTDDENVVHRLNPGDAVPKRLERFFVTDENQHRALQGDAEVVESAPDVESDAEGDGSEETGSTAVDYESLTVPDLQELLKQRELPQGGRKAELIVRLQEFDVESDAEGDGSEETEGSETDPDSEE